ncbi:MAG: KTSC domain-containing protein [Desulfarculaceae bacterium]|nr:KTSC domain-containing protein [Desulfarculaceae bacterium]
MDRSAVSSSALVSVGYEPSTMTLEIEFTGGSIYQYFDVPEVVYRELIGSDSLGQYFHSNIKDHFRYIKN